jgi:hypothetical protein
VAVTKVVGFVPRIGNECGFVRIGVRKYVNCGVEMSDDRKVVLADKILVEITEKESKSANWFTYNQVV